MSKIDIREHILFTISKDHYLDFPIDSPVFWDSIELGHNGPNTPKNTLWFKNLSGCAEPLTMKKLQEEIDSVNHWRQELIKLRDRITG